MARTPRTFSGRGHPEAKAGENIGQGKSREDVIEKNKQTNQQKEIVEVSLTRSSSRFVGVLRLLRCLRSTRFSAAGCGWSHLARRGLFLEAPKMQRNQPVSSHSAIPTRERLASRERECTWQTSGDEERLTIYRYCTAKNLKLVS